MIEFPTFAEAEAWYDSPEFQEAWAHLLKGSEVEGFIVGSV